MTFQPTFDPYAIDDDKTSPPEYACDVVIGEPLAVGSRAIYVGLGGDMRIRMLRGMVLTLHDVPTGSFLPLRIAEVEAEGTTADRIAAFW